MPRMEVVADVVAQVMSKHKTLPSKVDDLPEADCQRIEEIARTEGITPQQALDAANAVIADKQSNGDFDPAAIAAAARANR